MRKMKYKITKNKADVSLWILILIVNVYRIILGFKLTEKDLIFDVDYLKYYKPVADNFSETYFNNDKNFTSLSAQVTPIFPLFLKLTNFANLGMLLTLVASILVLVITYFISSKYVSSKFAKLSVLFVSIEPAFFASTINLAPESIFSFVVLLGLFFGICKPLTYTRVNYFIFFICLSFSVIIKPVSLVTILFVFVLCIIQYYRSKKLNYIFYAILTAIFPILWSIRNFWIHGFFNVSTIASHNLFFYEGVAALAEESDMTFEEAVNNESIRRQRIIGESSEVIKLYEYNLGRGQELIINNPFGFLISHIKGIGKLFFGIYKSRFIYIFKDVYRIESQMLIYIFYLFLLLIIIFIWFMFMIGIIRNYKNFDVWQVLMLLIIITILLPASGQIAYARFRAPVSPIICIFAALGAKSISQELSNQFNSNYYLAKFIKAIKSK